MMTSSSTVDVPHTAIKYEAPYDLSVPLDSQPHLKRRRSDEDHNGDKRQKVDPDDCTCPLYYDYPRTSDQSANPPSQSISDAHHHMRLNSLNILENLSTQILATLSQGSWEETIRMIAEPETEHGQAYATIKGLFDNTKKIYTQQETFLSVDKLNIEEPSQRAIIRITNLATFVSGVFGGDVGFYELNDHFLETFIPLGETLSEEQGHLLLNLKTQVYISALSQEESERTNKDILHDMFPADLRDLLNVRHPDIPPSQEEIDFIELAHVRRELLLSESRDVESIQKLSDRYGWDDFLRSLRKYLRRAYEPLIAPYRKCHICAKPRPAVQAVPVVKTQDDFALEAEREIQKALLSFNGKTSQLDQEQSIPQPPDQSEPTHVLYEKARQATIAKSTNPGSARRPNLPSQRRPWTQEEESMLMSGLDLVKGPHWSQILALYGPEGTVNHILKDRNQVQLKDKARNLKLFFLKSNTEVPHYLQAVTGELKTRAPSQAAKKEAEERARLASADEQLRITGIMALSGISQQSEAIEEAEGSLSPSSDVTLSSSRDLEFEDGPDEAEAEPETETARRDSPQTTADDRLREQLSAHNKGTQ